MKFEARTSVVRRSPCSWYIKGVNINYSFERLEQEAINLGASVEAGDVLVVDNVRGDKRKAFKKTTNGCIILYAKLFKKNIFTELHRQGKGRIRGSAGTPLIDLFNI